MHARAARRFDYALGCGIRRELHTRSWGSREYAVIPWSSGLRGCRWVAAAAPANGITEQDPPCAVGDLDGAFRSTVPLGFVHRCDLGMSRRSRSQYMPENDIDRVSRLPEVIEIALMYVPRPIDGGATQPRTRRALSAAAEPGIDLAPGEAEIVILSVDSGRRAVQRKRARRRRMRASASASRSPFQLATNAIASRATDPDRPRRVPGRRSDDELGPWLHAEGDRARAKISPEQGLFSVSFSL